jgi:hypothetical protein
MSITIKTTADDAYEVNDKPIYKDTNGNLVQFIELTTAELKAFNDFLKSQNAKKNKERFDKK